MFCIMILMVVIAGCSKEEKKKIIYQRKQKIHTVKHAMGETTVNGTPKKLLF